MSVYFPETVDRAARRVKYFAIVLGLFAVMPLGCSVGVEFSGSKYPISNLIILISLLVLGLPAAVLFGLSFLVERGSLWATAVALAFCLLPAALVTFSLVSVMLSGNICGLPFALLITVPTYFAVSACWSAISDIRRARPYVQQQHGFDALVKPLPPGQVQAKQMVIPPRPGQSTRRRESKQ